MYQPRATMMRRRNSKKSTAVAIQRSRTCGVDWSR
jgi:hypothetical protein